MFYVNEYVIDQRFGGPEEGGWWFDVGFFQRQIFKTGDEALAQHVHQAHRKTELPVLNEGRREITSVLSQGRYEVYIQCDPGTDFPQYQPHYE